jgi:uncharacterized membrane protein YesL
MSILRVYGRTLLNLNLRGFLYVWANLLFFLLCLPVITAPAAWAGLIRLSHRVQTQPNPSLDDFWQGFREHFWRSSGLGLISLLIVILNISNFLAYSGASGLLATLMRGVWIGIPLLWFSLLLYVWPLLEEMQEPNLRGALRNAFFMFLQNPFFTLALWPVVLLLFFLSFMLPVAFALITMSSIATLSSCATLDRLKAAGYQNPEHYQIKTAMETGREKQN